MKSQSLFLAIIFSMSSVCSQNNKQSEIAVDSVTESDQKIEVLEAMAKAEKEKAEELLELLDGARLENDKCLYEKEELSSKINNIHFLSTGKIIDVETEDPEVYGKAYRVEIYINNNHKTIYVKEIEYFGEGSMRLVNERKIPLERILKINPVEASELEFKEWIGSNKFLITLKDNVYSIDIQENFIIGLSPL